MAGCGCWSSKTSQRWRAARARTARGGPRGRRRRDGRGRALDGACRRLRRRSCSTSCCPASTASRRCRALRERGGLVTGSDAHRARRGRGSRRRARRRRRRLPDQAVLVRASCSRGCARSSAGAPRASVRPCSRSATCGSIPAARRVWRGDSELQLSGREFALLEAVHAATGRRRSRGCSCSTAPGTWRSRAGRTSSTSTFATSARRSTGRSARASIETVRGVGYRLRRTAR